jgi:FkbH-like protein
MTLTFGLADEQSLPRIVQLLGKTNQFNLTTRRHNAAELQAMLDAGGIILWSKLRDRFGDNGLIAVGIVLPEDAATWRLDSFLMSCRVIGRGVETALLSFIIMNIKSRGASSLLAEFIPTRKNQPALAFLTSHGFTKLDDSSELFIHSLHKEVRIPDCFRTQLSM